MVNENKRVTPERFGRQVDAKTLSRVVWTPAGLHRCYPNAGGGSTQTACVANHLRALSGFGPQTWVCDDSSGSGSVCTVWRFDRIWPAVRQMKSIALVPNHHPLHIASLGVDYVASVNRHRITIFIVLERGRPGRIRSSLGSK